MNYGKKVESVQVLGLYGMAVVCANVLDSGEVCRVDYIKKDGTETTMLCRTGVKKHLKGTGKSPTNLNKGLLSVWSFDRQGYRTINVGQIKYIKHGGIVYDFRNLHLPTTERVEPGAYQTNLTGRTIPAITSPLY